MRFWNWLFGHEKVATLRLSSTPNRMEIKPGAIIPCKADEIEYLTNFITVFEATWEQRCDPSYRVEDHK